MRYEKFDGIATRGMDRTEAHMGLAGESGHTLRRWKISAEMALRDNPGSLAARDRLAAINAELERRRDSDR